MPEFLSFPEVEQKSVNVFETEKRPTWKDFFVSVFGTASADKEGELNGREVGKLLAELGMGTSTGGYNTGAMKAVADGFKEYCIEHDVSADEMKSHLLSHTFDSNFVKPEIMGREVIPDSTIVPQSTPTKRLASLTDTAGACIALRGTFGTLVEFVNKAFDASFKAMNAKEGKGRPRIEPLILLDHSNKPVDAAVDYVKEYPKMLNSMTDDIFVLAGHKTKDGEIANLENDPQMREELKMILEYYYLIGQSRSELSAEQKKRIEEIQAKVASGLTRFRLFKDVVSNKLN